MKRILTESTNTLTGNRSGLTGDYSRLYGDCSGLRGNLEAAELTAEERTAGVDIRSLIVTGE